MSTVPFIKINDIKIITSSSYITKHNTDCIICRQSINNDSIYSKKDGIRSVIISGICGHMFHDECIKLWLSTNNKCPICLNIFKFND